MGVENGPLYRLWATYPVIDGVGYARLQSFVRVSLSKYYRHDTKLFNLSQYTAPENKSSTILNYYKDQVSNIEKVLYVYVSAHNYYKSGKFPTRSTKEIQYVEMQHL